MAKFQCRCGRVLSTSTENNNVELAVFTNNQFDSLSVGPMTDESFNEGIWRHTVAWWCSICQRLYTFGEDGYADRVWALEKETPPDAEIDDSEWTEELETRTFDSPERGG